MTISTLISSVLQLVLFSAVPFIFWLIWGRKKGSFFEWIGLSKPMLKNKPKFYIFFIATFILYAVLGMITVRFFTGDTELASSEFYGLGFSGLAAVAIYAFIKTGLSEEIVFRGLIGKRLCAKIGFHTGNMIQAFLFGLLHGVMLFPSAGIFNAAVVTLMTGSIGWVMGYMNEKLAGGSILPSWIIHGLSNFYSSALVLFNITLL